MNSQFPVVRRIAILTVLVSALGIASSAKAQSPDLAVVKTTKSSLVAANTDVVYDVIVANNSAATTSGQVVLTDAVPPNMTFVAAAAPDGWVCMTPAVGGTGTITCTYDAAVPDESVFAFTFIFHVNPGTPNDTVITNTANITNNSDSNVENNGSSASVTVGEPPPPPPPPLGPRDVLISEFRLIGPGSGDLDGQADADEYIELYCNRDIDCDLTGVVLRYRDPTLPPLFEEEPPGGEVVLTFPQGITIRARQFLLIANSDGFSLFDYTGVDIDISGDATFYDNEGFQLIQTVDEPFTLDSVGFAGGGNSALYVEGTGLQRATGERPGEQYAYVRKRTLASNGRPQDTDDNFSDFVLVSVTGNPHPGIVAPVLGAPGPKSSFSPRTYSNSEYTASLVEPGVSRDVSPNRVRTGSGNSGTLSVRRSFTNNTGFPIAYVGFRVIDITTLNSPGDAAQLRLITSGDAESFINSENRTVNILGTTLEFDPSCGCEPAQPIGGGLNSSVAANIPVEPGIINPGETIDVQFLMNVVKAGGFKLYIYVEAFPIIEGGENDSAVSPSRSRVRLQTVPARRFINIHRETGLPSNKAPRPRKRPGLKDGGAPTQITPPPVAPKLTPFVIINRGSLEEPKPVRRKTRVRRKSSKALKLKVAAEDKTAEANQAEKPQN
jgi:uncharacterized repeat protein (TIGR01451 family)